MNVVLGCWPKCPPRPKTQQRPASPSHYSQRLVCYHNASQKQAKEKTNAKLPVTSSLFNSVYVGFHDNYFPVQLDLGVWIWWCAIVVDCFLDLAHKPGFLASVDQM